MTVKDFSDRYGIEYITVYNAAWRAKPLTQSLRYRQYREEDLKSAIRKEMEARIERHRQGIRKAEEIMELLNC